MATLESMQAKIKKLEQQAEALIAKQSSGVIEKIRDLMEKHGLTTADIDAHVGGKKRTKKSAGKSTAKPATSAAKYRDPKSGATWSGHGRAPKWIAAAKNRDKYLVDASTVVVEPAPAKKANAAGVYVRGPQPAMYRDPKSGATWSGRGRAPAWLATVRDRTKFLIDGTAAAPAAASKTNEPKGEAIAVAKKALAKKVVAKKATAKNVTAKKATVKAAVQVAPTAEKTAAAKKSPAKKSSVASKKAAVKKASTAPEKTSAVSAKKVAAKKVAEAAVKRTSAKKVVAKKTVAVKESASADVVAASTGDVAAPDVAVATGA